jgi:hypothetical protein
MTTMATHYFNPRIEKAEMIHDPGMGVLPYAIRVGELEILFQSFDDLVDFGADIHHGILAMGEDRIAKGGE